MPHAPAVVAFFGATGDSAAERMVDEARLAATMDVIEAALRAGCSRGILVTDRPDLTIDVPGVEVDVSTEPYHFGRRLAAIVRQRGLSPVIYIGAGSVPLFTEAGFARVIAGLGEGACVTNNTFSSDLIAFTASAPAIAAAEAVERDNALARSLGEAGLRVEELPRTVATQLDIDSPTDLLVLALTGAGGPRLRAHVAAISHDTTRYARTLPLFTDRRAQVVVAGRVGSHAWAYLERETACRVRLFAEERGMEADGRADSGAARSLLGFYLDAIGLERFFETLAELGDAAFIDTRVLLAHRGLATSRADRFASDLGDVEAITEPFLREFTRAATDAAIPLLLGGHSLMSGGLMALNEHAWALSESAE